MNIHALPDDEEIVGSRRVSKITGYSMSTLAKKRCDGSGPPFIRLSNRKTGYRLRDVRTWLNSLEQAGRQQKA